MHVCLCVHPVFFKPDLGLNFRPSHSGTHNFIEISPIPKLSTILEKKNKIYLNIFLNVLMILY